MSRSTMTPRFRSRWGYQGLNEEGEHLWLQVSPDTLPRSKLKSYHMDKLPEHIVIRFGINEFT